MPFDLPSQVIAREADENDMAEIAPYVRRFAQAFGKDAEGLCMWKRGLCEFFSLFSFCISLKIRIFALQLLTNKEKKQWKSIVGLNAR